MGYSTDFSGQFKLDRPLLPEHKDYLNAFSKTRRMNRSDRIIQESFKDPICERAGLPLCGAYFVNASGFMGQDDDKSVLDHNSPPPFQPGLWCQWIPSEDGTAIKWDGGEKFYNYVEWIQYLITHFLIRWGYTLNGEVLWQGEETGDLGKICISNNIVHFLQEHDRN